MQNVIVRRRTMWIRKNEVQSFQEQKEKQKNKIRFKNLMDARGMLTLNWCIFKKEKERETYSAAKWVCFVAVIVENGDFTEAEISKVNVAVLIEQDATGTERSRNLWNQRGKTKRNATCKWELLEARLDTYLYRWMYVFVLWRCGFHILFRFQIAIYDANFM